MEKNINYITDNALCSACGACAAICQKDAITMSHNASGFLIAVIDEEKCINCGMCKNACPSVPENSISLDNVDMFHGNCIKGYIGYAAEDSIRQRSQSGGIVTALLCYLLEKKKIDGAIVNKFNSDTKRPQAVLANTKQSIIEGCGSYYTQSSVAETALNYSKENNIAAVVLGCQAESFMRIKQKYPKVKLPVYTIGLVCAGQNSGYMIDDLIEQSKCGKENKITHFRFRDKFLGNWPGNVGIYTNNKTYVLNKKQRHDLKTIYESYRCILCFNQMNIFSDIVVGDPWGIKRNDIKKGYSIFITRTKKGEELIENAIKDGTIIADDISIQDIIKGQTVDGRHKTKFYTAKDICIKNKWSLPYNPDKVKNGEYLKPNTRTYKNIFVRVSRARNFFIEKDNNKISAIIKRQKQSIKFKSIINTPLIFLKRCLSYAHRIIEKFI